MCCTDSHAARRRESAPAHGRHDCRPEKCLLPNPLRQVPVSSLREGRGLRHLELQGLSLACTEARLLSHLLPCATSLTSLSLHANRLDGLALQHLAPAIRVCRCLRTINLANNRLGAEGAAFLACALQTSDTVTALNLDDNYLASAAFLEPADLSPLCALIETSHTLASLRLRARIASMSRRWRSSPQGWRRAAHSQSCTWATTT